jgi:predicted ATPase
MTSSERECPSSTRGRTLIRDSPNERRGAGQIRPTTLMPGSTARTTSRFAYGVQYEAVDIERLSPGTRGIVILLLYLAIDREDDRPLIIDQPEENLDPKSVFDELVERFREARLQWQIIIVTHNVRYATTEM